MSEEKAASLFGEVFESLQGTGSAKLKVNISAVERGHG